MLPGRRDGLRLVLLGLSVAEGRGLMRSLHGCALAVDIVPIVGRYYMSFLGVINCTPNAIHDTVLI